MRVPNQSSPEPERLPERGPLPPEKQAASAASRMGWGLFLMMGLTQLGALALVLGVRLLAPALLGDPWVNWGLSYLPMYLLALPALWLTVRRLPAEPFPPPRLPLTPKLLGSLWVFGMGATYFLNLLSNTLAQALSLLLGRQVLNPLGTVAGHLPSAVVFGVVLAPAMEELIFRRLLLRRLLPLGEGTAVYGSAFLFALFHANLFQIPYAFVLGVILASLALAAGGIRGSVLLHMALNGVGAVLMPALAALGEAGLSAAGLLILALMAAAFAMAARRVVRVPSFPPGPLGLSPARSRRAFLRNPGMAAYLVLTLLLTALMAAA